MLVEYMLLNPNKQTEQKIYLHNDDISNKQYINELINQYKNDDLTVLKTYIKDKANMIQDNKIILSNGIEYILQV